MCTPLLFTRVDPFENRPPLEDDTPVLSVGSDSNVAEEEVLEHGAVSTGKTTHIHLAMWVSMWLQLLGLFVYAVVVIKSLVGQVVTLQPILK